MNNIWDVYLTIKNLIADKTRNSVPTPESISYALDLGQQSLFQILNTRKESGDDAASTALTPFIKITSLSSDSTGKLNYPADWYDTELITELIGGVWTSYNNIMDNEIYEAKYSTLYPIAQNPRYQEFNGYSQLFPEKVHNVSFKYTRKPTTPVIGYTVSGNTETYDAANSTQLDFSTAYYGQIILRSLPYIGVNLSDAEISQLVGALNLDKQ